MEGHLQRNRYVSIYAALIGVCFGACVMRLCDGAAADTSTCPAALTKLLPCLPYTQGTAKAPPSDCCSNLLDVHLNKPQCLCELVAASVKGTPGLPKMNTTLSLMLGPACNVATKPSVCPDLLGLAPDDPVAKIFTTGVASPSSANSSTTTPAAQGPSTTTTSSPNEPPLSNEASPVLLSLGVGFALASAVFSSLF